MSPRPRRRSIDSSDSDSSNSDSSHKSHKKKNKDKKHKHHGHDSSSGHNLSGLPSVSHFLSGHSSPQFPSDHAPAVPGPQFPTAIPQFPPSHGIDNNPGGGGISSPPPYTTQPTPPPSGFRLPLTTTDAFPDPQTLGQPPCYDADGSPIYIGSALLGNSVHPCKIGKHLQPYVAVPYGGVEYGHHGRYDLLPYRPDQMVFVPASYGVVPAGRRPVEGGYEDNGAKLYHAVALINGVKVPGKTGEHLGACNVAFGGAEHAIQNYEILCWR